MFVHIMLLIRQQKKNRDVMTKAYREKENIISKAQNLTKFMGHAGQVT